jgi:hypothetical protein
MLVGPVRTLRSAWPGIGQGSQSLFQGVVAELFGPAAEAVMQQARDQHLQPRYLSLNFEQHPPQRRQIPGGRSGTMDTRER